MAEEENNETKKTNEKPGCLKRLLVNPLTISLLIAIVLALVGLFIALKWLDGYTKHGEEISVPELTGKSVSEAELLLEKRGLTCEVIDSLYKTTVAPGAIVDQVPASGSKVKEGRKIYLYIRARKSRQVALPDLKDLSLREAEATLDGIGLKVKDVEFEPNPHQGLVLSAKANNKEIKAGTKLPEGSAVTLKVGRGMSNELTPMISFRGMNEETACRAARDNFLTIASVVYDIKPAEESKKSLYQVYKQSPVKGTKINGSERIIIYLTTDNTKLSEPEEVAEVAE